MKLEEAKDIAGKLFDGATLTTFPDGSREVQVGGKMLGRANSWAGALRDAVERKHRGEIRAAQAEAIEFSTFLREKYAAEFDAWKITGGKRTSLDAVCPEDLVSSFSSTELEAQGQKDAAQPTPSDP